MDAKNRINGAEPVLKAQTGSDSLKAEIRPYLHKLPSNWRDLMKAQNPYYKTDSGNNRLTNIRSLRVAPTLDEVSMIKGMSDK
jgi:molybdenum-dependent DNA-binding transcriptional regulator ModE